MEQVTWKDEYLMGIPEIDSQHKKIASLIDKLSKSIKPNSVPEVFNDALAELGEHVKYHLKYEEQLLKENGYPEYEHHYKSHRKFQEEYTDLAFQAIKGDPLILIKLRNFIIDWFFQHILEDDQDACDFLKDKNIS